MIIMKNGEAAKIYRSIFRKDIPGIVQQRFENPSVKLESAFPESDLIKYRKIIDRISDLAAVEYASRITGTNQLLIKKFQIMIYLGECMPGNFNVFINEKRGLIRTLLMFTTIPFNSVYKFIKGFLALKIKTK
ncbi:MAG: hypothetical protein KAS21_03555 [Candidatus Aminicenantes bacterium]|nr:hypothetical protein [Candidatus Aminicenantes bacterium]